MHTPRIRPVLVLLLWAVTALFTPLSAQDAVEILNESHIGGWSVGCALDGGHLYWAHGTFVSILDVSGEPATEIGSIRLSAECSAIKVHNGHLYVFNTWRDTALVIYNLDNPAAPRLVNALPMASEYPFQGDFYGNTMVIAMDSSLEIFDITTAHSPQLQQTIDIPAQCVRIAGSHMAAATEDSLLLYRLIEGSWQRHAGAFHQGIRGMDLYNGAVMVGSTPFPGTGFYSYSSDLEQLDYIRTAIVDGNTTSYKNPRFVEIHNETAYVGCSGSAHIFVIDLMELNQLLLLGIGTYDEGSYPAPQSMVLDYPRCFMTTGSSDDGVLCWDLTDVLDLKADPVFEAPWDMVDMTTRQDTLYVASMERLWTYRFNPDGSYETLGSDDNYSDIRRIHAHNGHLLTLDNSTFRVLDTVDPFNLAELGSCNAGTGDAMGLSAYGNHALLLSSSPSAGILEWADITNPADPQVTASYVINGQGRVLKQHPSLPLAFVAINDNGSNHILILDYSNLGSIQTRAQIPVSGLVTTLCLSDTTLLAGSVDQGTNTWSLQSFGVSNIDQPVAIAQSGGTGIITGVKVTSDLVLATIQGDVNGVAKTVADRSALLHPAGDMGPGALVIFGLLALQFLQRLIIPIAIAIAVLPAAAGNIIMAFLLGFMSPVSMQLSGSTGAMASLAAIQNGTAVDLADLPASGPQSPVLEQNYPNPFNPTTTISYELAQGADVKLTVYDINGKEVGTLVDGYKGGGLHRIIFDGREMASGLYTYVLEVDGKRQTQKMLLVK